jgi:hypothetical protein
VFIDPHVHGDINKKNFKKLIFDGAKGSPLSYSGANLHNTRYMQPAIQKAWRCESIRLVNFPTKRGEGNTEIPI